VSMSHSVLDPAEQDQALFKLLYGLLVRGLESLGKLVDPRQTEIMNYNVMKKQRLMKKSGDTCCRTTVFPHEIKVLFMVEQQNLNYSARNKTINSSF